MADAGTANVSGTASSTTRLVAPEDWPDPHPYYHRLRAETPILAVPEWDELVCTRWADCERILRDHTFSSDTTKRRTPAANDPRANLDLPPSLLFMDPPDHTRPLHRPRLDRHRPA